MKFIIGKKIKMIELFKEDGKSIPVTLIKAGPCQVTCIRQKEKEGYDAVQVGYEDLKPKKISKTRTKTPFRHLKEFRVAQKECELKLGDKIDVSTFSEGDSVKVSGISKGKGFQGAVKRWGFKGRKSSTHGTKHELRNLGSVGCSFPERVIKGRKMAGRMGHERVTVRNLEIVKIDKDRNIIALKGAVPGRKGTLLEIKGS